jgi:LmbE family N-acetylglucosaminyl deacetylase
MGRSIVFVAGHPDDETLGAGVAIAEHVAAGRDVHVLLLTRGTASATLGQLNGTSTSSWWGVAHNPAQEGYEPLTADDLGAARVREFRAALAVLGVASDHIHEATDAEGNPLLDGQVSLDDAKYAIHALASTLPTTEGVVGLWAPSYVVDNSSDHLAAGMAVRQLGIEQPTVYSDRRYYVLPMYWSDPRLSQVPGKYIDSPTDAVIRQKTINALRSYGAWQPEGGAFAVGYHSVYASAFAPVLADVHGLVHKDA